MMTLVITFFAIPIGILLVLSERKTAHAYQAVFDDFLLKIQNDDSLDTTAKMDRLRAMLERNQYDIISKNQTEIQAEKKLFSVGFLSIGTGFMYIGAALYILYYFKFQKPHRVKFSL